MFGRIKTLEQIGINSFDEFITHVLEYLSIENYLYSQTSDAKLIDGIETYFKPKKHPNIKIIEDAIKAFSGRYNSIIPRDLIYYLPNKPDFENTNISKAKRSQVKKQFLNEAKKILDFIINADKNIIYPDNCGIPKNIHIRGRDLWFGQYQDETFDSLQKEIQNCMSLKYLFTYCIEASDINVNSVLKSNNFNLNNEGWAAHICFVLICITTYFVWSKKEEASTRKTKIFTARNMQIALDLNSEITYLSLYIDANLYKDKELIKKQKDVDKGTEKGVDNNASVRAYAITRYLESKQKNSKLTHHGCASDELIDDIMIEHKKVFKRARKNRYSRSAVSGWFKQFDEGKLRRDGVFIK